ncbi:MAG: DUF3604 domain-containing protein [Pseudomonadales bacterium]
MKRLLLTLSMPCLLAALASGASAEETTETAPDRQLLWGDTHLHTNNSFDAFLNGNMTVTPSDAYRFAKGEPVIHAYNRVKTQIGTPLDFLVVTDHAEFLGGIKDIYYDGIQDPDPGLIRSLVYWYQTWRIRDALDNGGSIEFFNDILPIPGDPRELAAQWVESAAQQGIPGAKISQRKAWHGLLETADRHNEPGKFTAFAGWEWSSQPGSANLHRIVMTSANADSGKTFIPFASTDSPYPDDLWAWLAKTEAESNARFIAIPHNPNVSKGMMFNRVNLRGEAIDEDYANRRLQYEPMHEMTQIKGDEETHPLLSPDDEFAKFEPYQYLLAAESDVYPVQEGDYVRSGLKTGLSIEAEIGVNPFKLGMIGSTDSHTGLATAEEANFWGKFAFDSVPEKKNSHGLGSASGWTMSAAGLAAVWAEENTRDGILDAMFRREVYATTGTRISLRFFGGADLTAADLETLSTSGYEKGVPMGGTLSATEEQVAPTFLVHAGKDPADHNLDRIQIVKGWLDADGETHEQVYNVAWSDDRELADDGSLPAVPDTVDRNTGKVTGTHGAPELKAAWTDPDFNTDQPALYYVRVLQIPSARHSLFDRIALGLENAADYPDVIQERAYSSPIWYQP